MFSEHPKGLLSAALSNIGERFGYYIMNAVLVLFLCSKFGLSNETSALIYSFFYAGIYILSLVGGLIADRTSNYKGTIQVGLIIMAAGYVILSIPILATPENSTWLLTVTCVALFMIAFGNGLFKGNLLMALKLPNEIRQDASDRRTLLVKCTKKWNITPILSKKASRKLFEEERVVVNEISNVPFRQAPFELKIRSKNVLNWEYDVNGFEQIPKKCSFSEESLERTYVPFGCTLTRIAKFPKCLK